MRKIGQNSKDILLRDSMVMSPLTRPYELVVDHAEGSTIIDVDGNSYLDFAAGVAVMNIGYNCRRVMEAIRTRWRGWCTAGSRISALRCRSGWRRSSAG